MDHRLSDRNRTIEATALPETVADLLARAASLFPDAVALNFFEQGEQLDYATLRRTVLRIACGFDGIGIRHGDHVAVMLSNRIEYPVVWLALAELGAVMIPIVLSSTPREIAFFLTDADAAFLVVERGYLSRQAAEAGIGGLPPAARIVLVGDTPEVADENIAGAHRLSDLVDGGDPAFVAPRAPTRDDLLNIQYTSGTTGLPKGAMLSHRYWIVCGAVPQLVFGMPFMVTLSAAPFFYLDPQWILISAMHCGGRVDYAERLSVKRWVDRLHACRTDVAWLNSKALKLPARPEEKAAGLKLFLGYHSSREQNAIVRERFGAPTREMYGSTEIGCGLCVPLDIDDDEILGTCGIEAPFRRLRIVRPDGSDAAPNEPGELLVSGDGILKGYYNRPEANAEFQADGWFRTGDLFVRNEKGYYSIVGRIKDMVRRSSENISAIEVEQVLTDMPQIADAAIVAVPDPDRGEEVKAYILPASGVARIEVEDVLAHCRQRLAPFKVPRYIGFVTEFPYTASSKIAKKTLTAGVEDLRAGSWDAACSTWL